MEQWISLIDYAAKEGISLSTLRRHIKSNKISFKLEKGRYLLLHHEKDNPNQDALIEQLTHELKKAQEEIAELKMLVAIYEETLPKQRLDV